MNHSDLIKAVASETKFTQKDVNTIIDALSQIVVDGMKDGESVKLFDGLTLSSKVIPATERRNPKTNTTFMAPPVRKPVCKFGKAIKEYVKED